MAFPCQQANLGRSGSPCTCTPCICSAIMPVSSLFFVGAAVLSGLTSVKGASMTGVYSDGRTLHIKGEKRADQYVLGLMN